MRMHAPASLIKIFWMMFGIESSFFSPDESGQPLFRSSHQRCSVRKVVPRNL